MTAKKNNDHFEIIDVVTQLNYRTIFLAILVLLGGFGLLMYSLSIPDPALIGLSLVLFIIGLPLLLCIEKIAVNSESKTVHIYNDYYLYKSGEKKSTEEYEYVVIFFDLSSDPDGGNIGGATTNFYGSSSRHYEVFLIGKDKRTLFIREYDQPKLAKNLQAKLAEKLALKATNEIIKNYSPDQFNNP